MPMWLSEKSGGEAVDIGKEAEEGEGGEGGFRGCEDRCSAMCCSAINLVPILARKCSSRNRVIASGLM